VNAEPHMIRQAAERRRHIYWPIPFRWMLINCRKNLRCQRPWPEGWSLGRFGQCFSHCQRTPANLQSRNFLEQTVQRTNQPDLQTLNCQHAMRTKPL